MADKLKIFVSSPGDVGQERVLTTKVIERLNGEFSRYFEIQPYLWEHEPLRSSAHFQQQIMLPSETNIVVFILWSRLGTKLPENITRSDGSPYTSGTEFEFENALEAFKEKGMPDLLVYRKIQDPNFIISDESLMLEKLEQKRALDRFVDKWFGSAATGFKAAFHTFCSPDEFENILEVHLRKLIRDKIPEIPVSIPVKRWYQNPFRGLEAFEYEHAPVFFGRTKAISEIIERITPKSAGDLPFLMVYGMSGCGKSSLVKAGVVPTLTQPGVIEGIGLWRRASLRPSDSPDSLLLGLETALIHNTALPEMMEEAYEPGVLAQQLMDRPNDAVRKIEETLKKIAVREREKYQLANVPECRLVLVVDQLEELFTLDRITTGDREKFIFALSVLLDSGKVWIISTMRSDFYHRCSESPQLVRILEGQEYRLANPVFTEIGQMIRNPAIAAGLSFEVNPKTGERLDDRIHEAAARGMASLPLLEFTLTELFKQRRSQKNGEEIMTLQAYEALGGLEGALARRAEDVYISLDDEARSVFPSVFKSLATAGVNDSHTPSSQRAAYDEIAPEDRHKRLLDAFIRERLIVSDRDSKGTVIVRIAHEAMLQCWPRLKNLLMEAEEFLRLRKHFSDSAMLWQQEGKKRDYLLQQGRPVQEAIEALEKYSDEFTPQIVEFIKASIKRSRHLKQLKGLLVSAAFLVITVFSTITWLQLQEVSTQRQMALDGQIELLVAASNESCLAGDRIGGLKFSLAAYEQAKQGETSKEQLESIRESFYPALYYEPFSCLAILKGHDGLIEKTLFSPDGNYLLTCSSDGTARMWDPNRCEELYRIDPSWERISFLDFSRDGRMFLIFSDLSNEVFLYETKTGKMVSAITLQVEAAPLCWNFSILPGNEKLFAFRGNYKQLYDIKTGELIKEYEIKGYGEDQALTSPDARFFVSLIINQGIWAGDIETGATLKELSDTKLYSIMVISPNSKYFAASNGTDIKLWRTSDWSLIKHIQGESIKKVASIGFNATEDGFLIAYAQHGLKILDIPTGNIKLEIAPASEEDIYKAEFSKDGKLLYTLADTVDIWDAQNGKKFGTLDLGASNANDAAFSPDSKTIVCGLSDYSVRLYSCRFSETYENLAFFEGDIVHQINIPNADKYEPMTLVAGHTYAGELYANPNPIYSSSPDGRYFSACYPDGFIEIYDRIKQESGEVKPRWTFNNHTSSINTAFFSFDSRLIITSSYDGKATLYDIESGTILHELKGHSGPFYTAEFSNENQWVFTWNADQTVRVWSVVSGKELFRMSANEGIVADVGFDPDYEYLIMVMEDGHGVRAKIIHDIEGLAALGERVLSE